jgi:hypothetical protein
LVVPRLVLAAAARARSDEPRILIAGRDKCAR